MNAAGADERLVDVINDLVASGERLLREGHDFWEKHQRSPDSDRMSAALTDLYMAHKRAERAVNKVA